MKFLLAITLAVLATSCNAKSEAEESLPRRSLESMGWEAKAYIDAEIDFYDARYFDVLIYQHKESGKCIAFTPSIRGGTMSEVTCELYGIMSAEQAKAAKKAKVLLAHKQAIAKAKEEYERLLALQPENN